MLSYLLLVSSASALLVAPLGPRLETRAVSPAMSATSRRAHLEQVAAAGAMLALATPLAAKADTIEEIAARANAKAQAEREAVKAERIREEGEGTNLVGGAVLASVVLAVPFFAQNLQRLGIKISTGEDPRVTAAKQAEAKGKKRR